MPALILASASPRRSELLRQAGYAFTVVPAQGEEKRTSTVPSELVLDLSRQKAEEVRERLRTSGGIARFFAAAAMTGAENPPAGGKLPEAAVRSRSFVVLGADTVVAVDGEVLGKPQDEADAFRMLALLRGRAHEVYTGVTLLAGEETEVDDSEADGKKADGGKESDGKADFGKRDGVPAPERENACASFFVRTEVVFDAISDAELRAYIASGEPMDKAGAYGIQGALASYIREIRGDYYNVVGLPLCETRRRLRAFGIAPRF